MTTAAVIFIATYIVVALGYFPGLRLDRTGAAVVGAAFMVAFRVITPEQSFALIDMGTLVLLFGMMVIVGHLRLAGFFRAAGAFVARHSTTPHRLLAGLIGVSGLLSALFVNDTICLALTPLVIEVTGALGVRATPYLIALATASNIGSVATLTGNPQNMLIGVASGISYAAFFARLVVVALVGLMIDYFVVAFVYRRDLAQPFAGVARPRVRIHGFLILKGLTASIVMLFFFFIGANLSIVALTAGATLLLTRRVKPEKVFIEIHWSLLTLFAGLFVVVGAARLAGLADWTFALLHAREARSLELIAVICAALSNVVSNVPAVMLFIPLVPHLPDPHGAWLVLAMASTLAGNLTLVGSIANLIVAEGARRSCPIGFREYLKVGVPLTLLTLAFGIFWLR
ncbi:MAG: anion transporter [Vicinamibacteria bacterium]|jgi:Na+/H+ antiporter NhaD/arsenite permease-like protein|nr:anion transporter [Vicinamibacteria bacterium]